MKKSIVVLVAVVVGALVLLLASGALAGSDAPTANGPAYGMQYRAFSGLWQRLLDIEADGSASSTRDVFAPAGGIFGLTFIGDTLYGVECDNPCAVGAPDYYLVTLPRVGAVNGARVGATPIGISNVDGLTYCAVDGMLYGTGFDFSAHQTTLFTVNPGSGVGTPVGTLSTDVWIVGLACDPTTGTLYGVSSPFGANTTPKLYTINRMPVSGALADGRAAASETVVGELGTPLQSLAWDSDLGRLIGAFDKLYTVNTGTGAASEIGGDYTTGTEGDGLYGLAYYAGDAVPPTATPTATPTVGPTATATGTATPTATPKYRRYVPLLMKRTASG